MDQNRLSPPPTKGHLSVAKLPRYWYVACQSKELRQRPIERVVLGTPVALFRDADGNASTVLDRCPHRNVPLSSGRVVDGCLECCYHGWRFAGNGDCTAVPGLQGELPAKAARVTAFPTCEQDGLVWIYADPSTPPRLEPPSLPLRSAPGYTTFVQRFDLRASLHAAIENTLDVPHTAFLHKGFFRGGKQNAIRVTVRRWHDRCEAQFEGEPRPPGIAGKVLSPSGGVVEHWDRFILPSMAQVEYRLGPENHIVVNALMTPVTDFQTRLHSVVSFRVRLPSAVVRPLLAPMARKILRQDADILTAQTDCIERFGGEQFASTEIDLLGNHIWWLLKRAEGGYVPETSDEAPLEKRLEFLA